MHTTPSPPAAPKFGDSLAVVVIGGVLFFIGANMCIAKGLKAVGAEKVPSCVVGIVAVGAVCAHPRLGKRVFNVLGPSATWLRAMLPLMLVPPLAAPLSVDPPDWKYVLLVTGSMMATLAASGHLAAIAGGGGALTAPLGGSDLQMRAAVSARTLLTSPTVALGALGLGMTASLIAKSYYDSAWDARCLTPVLAAGTVSAYVAAGALLPAKYAVMMPPGLVAGAVVVAGIVLPALCTPGAGIAPEDGTWERVKRSCRVYLDGAGSLLMSPVRPLSLSLVSIVPPMR
jgi:hypothetical protein